MCGWIDYEVVCDFLFMVNYRLFRPFLSASLESSFLTASIDAPAGHAEAFAADSCSDLLVFLLDMNNAPFVIDSVFISLSLIKGAYQSETGVIL